MTDDRRHGRLKNYGVLVVLTGKHLGRPPDLALLVGPPLQTGLSTDDRHVPSKKQLRIQKHLKGRAKNSIRYLKVQVWFW